ncbi:RNA polymerase sigma-70 factor [Castellaniella ginsengisoli]|jgi:RNA polymerase sigma-70 factor (TIGR02957 family)|uniref:RNA polymerase sigma-70 factor n=1 Tax=Castellaniella ginsengisoli TaxID=546114 RepID=A0AB39EQ68_9BURK
MSDATLTFNHHRPRLQRIAYRMLGSWAEAEDVVQDAWLKWHAADHATLANIEAWLVSVTTRLSIDRLRSVKSRREHYIGAWLPEPDLTDLADAAPSPEQALEHAHDVSYALLAVLERLAPEARAAFLLRDVFDEDYGEIARVLDRTEAACRQLVHRARIRLKDERKPAAVAPETQHKLLRAFAQAASTGDFTALKSVLAADAQLVGDGGGKVASFGVPLLGGQRIAQLYLATCLRYRGQVRCEVALAGGQWRLLRFIDGKLESAQYLETDGTRITRIHAQRNPEKLAGLARALGCELSVPV